MNTLVLSLKNGKREKSIKCAGEILRKGGIVAFPTETVYGLGANALDEEAIKKIYKAKGRPSDNPLIVHISNKEDIEFITDDVPEICKKLMENFWPGPLTLLFKKNNTLPNIVTGGLSSVAVRIPENDVALELIRESGVPVAAPSANLSGKPSPTKAEHVIEDLMGRIDAILIGDDCPVGIESTVLDTLSDPPILLRPGGISKERIEDVIGLIISGQNEEKSDIPKAPGMKYTHYAPKAPVIVFRGSILNMVAEIKKMKNEKENEGFRIGILATDETVESYTGCVFSVGSRDRIESIAGEIFHIFRCFDKENIDMILCESFTTEGMGLAVMNRIIKAAGYHVIDAGGEI